MPEMMQQGESPKARQAGETLRAALKAKKLLRIYPSNNSVYLKALEETHGVFTEFLNAYDFMMLGVKATELVMDGATVYRSLDRSDNLAVFFFKDGIKDLTFHRGLERAELEDFLRILSVDYDRDDSGGDFLSVFWERNFQHIKLTVDETVLFEDEGTAGGPGSTGDSGDTVGGTLGFGPLEGEDAVPQTDTGAPGDGAGSGEGASAATEEERMAQLHEDATEEGAISVAVGDTLTDAEMRLLTAEFEKESSARAGKIIGVLVRMLRDAADEKNAGEAVAHLRDIALNGFKLADFGPAVTVLEGVTGPAGSGSEDSPSARGRRSVIAFFSADDTIDRIGKIIDSTKDVDEQMLYRFARLLGGDALVPFATLLDNLQSIAARRVVNNILIEMGKGNVKHLISRLSDPTWYVVRNMVFILRHIGDPAALDPILRTARHPHERVRLEIIKAVTDFKSLRGLDPLKNYLGDGDATVRSTALLAMGQLARETPGAAEYVREALRSRIDDKSFDDRDFKEKKAFHEVLSSLPDQKTEAAMIEVLKKRTLFRNRALSERQAAAAYYLALAGSKAALPVLQGLRTTADLLVRDHVIFALRKLGHG